VSGILPVAVVIVTDPLTMARSPRDTRTENSVANSLFAAALLRFGDAVTVATTSSVPVPVPSWLPVPGMRPSALWLHAL
jgi:hypothetical protein